MVSKESTAVDFHEIDAPLFPVMPRPLEERLAPGLLHALVRWVARGAMYRDAETSVSRGTGGRA
jgi:hypothetical protein